MKKRIFTLIFISLYTPLILSMDPERKKELTSRPLPIPPKQKIKQRPLSMQFSKSCPEVMESRESSVKKAALAFFRALEKSDSPAIQKKEAPTLPNQFAQPQLTQAQPRSSTMRPSTRDRIHAAREKRKSGHHRKRSKSADDLLAPYQPSSSSVTSPIDPSHIEKLRASSYGIPPGRCLDDTSGDNSGSFDGSPFTAGSRLNDSVSSAARITQASNSPSSEASRPLSDLISKASIPEGGETVRLKQRAAKKRETLEELKKRMEEEEKEYLAAVGAIALREEQKKEQQQQPSDQS